MKLTVISIGLKQVGFSGDPEEEVPGYYDVASDEWTYDQQTPPQPVYTYYEAPHWQDNTEPLDGDANDGMEFEEDADRKWPVCFQRAKKVVAEVLMYILPDTFFDGTVKMKGEGSGLAFPETEASKDTGQATGALLSTQALPDHVDRYDPLYLNWYLSHDDGASWFGPFASGNECFVTRAAPQCTPRFRTVLYLATKGSEATTESQCVTDTWANFSGLNVRSWNKETQAYDLPLFYYASRSELPPPNENDPDIPPSDDTAGLLAARNGDCTGWADFLKECLLANNVANDVAQAGPSPWLQHVGGSIAVKDIRFTGTRYTSNGGDRECWTDVDDRDEYGVLYPNKKGQGEGGHTPAARVFNWHKVVKVGSTYYDSSYGGQPFADSGAAKADYTRNNIGAGWRYIECDDQVERYLWCEAAKTDGTLWDGPITVAP